MDVRVGIKNSELGAVSLVENEQEDGYIHSEVFVVIGFSFTVFMARLLVRH